jgi:hypothetical protein
MYKKLEVYTELDADHLQICKFGAASDGNYRRVLARIETIINDINQKRALERAVENLPVPVGTPSPAKDELEERMRKLQNKE